MWTNKTKETAETPSLKTKIETRVNRGFIITPDNFQILVGEDEDLVLIYQDEGSLWNNLKQKVLGGTWSQKAKVPIV